MKVDDYRICANCVNYRSNDRYHGSCLMNCEIRTVKGVTGMFEKRCR